MQDPSVEVTALQAAVEWNFTFLAMQNIHISYFKVCNPGAFLMTMPTFPLATVQVT